MASLIFLLEKNRNVLILCWRHSLCSFLFFKGFLVNKICYIYVPHIRKTWGQNLMWCWSGSMSGWSAPVWPVTAPQACSGYKRVIRALVTHVDTYWKCPTQHNEGGTQCCCRDRPQHPPVTRVSRSTADCQSVCGADMQTCYLSHIWLDAEI